MVLSLALICVLVASAHFGMKWLVSDDMIERTLGGSWE